MKRYQINDLEGLIILYLITLFTFFFAIGNATAAPSSVNDSLRYRGDYTIAHEVNSFCPQISSQCYWLSPETPHVVQQQLKALSTQFSAKPYEAICVVIEGRIDRDSEQKGFAKDYDGSMIIEGLYGECTKTNIVTHGDLQHHRWVLNTVNNVPVKLYQFNVLPTLDFGEKMFLAVNDGCKQFNADAVLENKILKFQNIEMIKNTCVTGNKLSDSLALSEKLWVITIPEVGMLELRSDELVLNFKLNDWR